MHAVVIRTTVDDVDASLDELRENVVPRVSQAPGFVSGYWTRKGNSGISMVIFESEDAAQSMGEMVRSIAPDSVTIDDIEVREVVAHA